MTESYYMRERTTPLSVCLPAYLPCFSACLPACLPLHTYLSAHPTIRVEKKKDQFKNRSMNEYVVVRTQPLAGLIFR